MPVSAVELQYHCIRRSLSADVAGEDSIFDVAQAVKAMFGEFHELRGLNAVASKSQDH